MKGCPDVYSRRKKVRILFSARRSGGKLIASGLCRCWSCIGIKTLSAIYSAALRAARSSWVCLAPRLEPRLLIFTVRAKHITSEPCRKPLPRAAPQVLGPKTGVLDGSGETRRFLSLGGSSIWLDVELSRSRRSGSGTVAKQMTGDRCVVLSEHSSCLPP